jgi:hypothetical protein
VIEPLLVNVCPECKQGKHPNCGEGAFDAVTDEPVVCDCHAANHPADAALLLR